MAANPDVVASGEIVNRVGSITAPFRLRRSFGGIYIYRTSKRPRAGYCSAEIPPDIRWKCEMPHAYRRYMALALVVPLLVAPQQPKNASERMGYGLSP
jgi:hypothetical protein